MLKAVRFSEDKHEDIIEYICKYRDSKGKKNESEAIRLLVQIGFKFITGKYNNKKIDEILDDELIKSLIINDDMKFEIESNALMQILTDNTETHSSDTEIETCNINNNHIENARDANEINYDNMKYEIINEIKTVNQSIDIDGIKKDIVNEVMVKLNQETLSSLTSAIEKLSALPTQPIQYVSQPQTNNQPIQPKPKPEPVRKKIEIPPDTNPLLANLLANANR